MSHFAKVERITYVVLLLCNNFMFTIVQGCIVLYFVR